MLHSVGRCQVKSTELKFVFTEDAPTNPFDTFSVSELLEQFAYHSRVKRERSTGKKLVPRIKRRSRAKAHQSGNTWNKDEQD